MLPATQDAQVSVRFIPTRLVPCIGCGKGVPTKTTPRVYCPECRRVRKLASARSTADKQRRKRGILQVKGTAIRCARCCVEVVLNRNRRKARYCKPCALEVQREGSRAASSLRAKDARRRDNYNAWLRAKRCTDPGFRLSGHMTKLMHRGLKGSKQGRSWKTFVPYTLAELKAHMERQFLKGMTWDNYGTVWHVDHIVPRRAFKYERPEDPEFRACWALTNLRPLWAEVNIRKQATRTHLL